MAAVFDVFLLLLLMTVGFASSDNQTKETGNATLTIQKTPSRDINALNPHIEQEMPPSIITPTEPKTHLIDLDEEFRIDCKGSGYPTPVYQWFRSGVAVDDSSPDAVVSVHGSVLVVKNIPKTFTGEFQCRATNKLGTSLSQFVVIQAFDYPESNDDNLKTYNVKSGEPFSLPCANLPKTNVPFKKRWYRSGKGSFSEYPSTTRAGTDERGTLHISRLENSDNSTELSCGLVTWQTIARGVNGIGLAKLNVTAKLVSGKEARKPILQYAPTTLQATIGGNVTLNCFFISEPAAQVEWLDSNNFPVKADDSRFEIKDFTRKLEIKKVTAQDEGAFKCTGRNDHGGQQHIIKLNVTTPPLAVPNKILASQTVTDHSDVTLYCETYVAKGEHQDIPIWLRNGKLLTPNNVPDPSRYKFSADRKELRITSLDKVKDTAVFQCNVSNSEGYKFYDGYLRVINSIEVTKRPEEVLVLEYGDVADVSVLARGDPCCNLNKLWTFNQTTIGDPSKWLPFQHNETTGVLLFNTSRVPKDMKHTFMGVYACRVSNQYESVDVSFHVIIKERAPKPVTVAEASTSLWWVGLVCGILAILIVAVVVFIIYKSRYPGSTYMLEEKEIKHNLNPIEDLMNQSFQEI